jgi:hypothetical protein
MVGSPIAFRILGPWLPVAPPSHWRGRRCSRPFSSAAPSQKGSALHGIHKPSRADGRVCSRAALHLLVKMEHVSIVAYLAGRGPRANRDANQGELAFRFRDSLDAGDWCSVPQIREESRAPGWTGNAAQRR